MIMRQNYIVLRYHLLGIKKRESHASKIYTE